MGWLIFILYISEISSVHNLVILLYPFILYARAFALRTSIRLGWVRVTYVFLFVLRVSSDSTVIFKLHYLILS